MDLGSRVVCEQRVDVNSVTRSPRGPTFSDVRTSTEARACVSFALKSFGLKCAEGIGVKPSIFSLLQQTAVHCGMAATALNPRGLRAPFFFLKDYLRAQAHARGRGRRGETLKPTRC